MLAAFAAVTLAQVAPALGAPTLTIGSASPTEGDAGTVDAVFTVALSEAAAGTETVDYTATAGTAAEGADFAATSGTLTFAPGDTSATITVPVNGDLVDETDETFTVDLANAAGGLILGDTQALGTILDDDTSVVTIGDVTVDEADGSATFTVSLSRENSRTVTVDFATANQSAVAGSDYTATSGTVTFAPGDTAKTIPVTIANDALDEPAETFAVDLSGPSNASLGDGQGIGTITDNDPTPTLGIGDPSVAEGNAGTATLTFPVSLSAASGQPVTVAYATADGSATAPTDYAATSGTLAIPAGDTSGAITVTVAGDTLDEVDETLTVTLSTPTNAALADGSGVGTITDDDAPPALTIDDVTVTEGNAGTTAASFTVSLSAPSGKSVGVSYATGNGSATTPADYLSAAGSLTFAPGETTKPVAVTVNGDVLDEADSDTAFVTLSGATNATIGDPTGQLSITDDDATPTINLADASLTEGDAGSANMTFTATLSAVSGRDVSVDVGSLNGTAVAPGDYTTVDATLTIGAGNPSGTVTVPVVGDVLDEDDETFAVLLSGASNVVIADGIALGTIIDDDPLPTVSISPAVGVTETNAAGQNATFTVTLSPASGRTVTVDYATADGTALAGVDYTATAGTLTFTAGQTVRTVDVPVAGDLIDEPVETFTMTLSNAPFATIGTGTGTASITDDDPLPAMQVADASTPESAALGFTVSLSNPSSQAITVNYTTASGTTPDAAAVSGADFTGAAGVLTFAPGVVTQTIPVTVANDLLDENDETLTVTLSGASAAGAIADGVATGTIVDDDAPPALTISDVNGPEGNAGTSTANLTVTLTPPSGRIVTVDYATGLSGEGSDATAGIDYVATAGTLTFAPGETVRQVGVTVIGDLAVEGSETLGVSLTNAPNATLPARPGLVVIADDDQTPVPPFPAGDTIVTARNTPGGVDVVANDTDANGDFLFVSGNTDGLHGSASCTFVGICTYTPATGYLGPDSFTYTVNDGLQTAVGTVTVTVFRPNNAPVATADSVRTVANFSTAIPVLANDTDPQGDRITISGRTTPAHGTVTCTATRCTYRPRTGFVGGDSFTYTATDGELTSTGTVRIAVLRRKALRPSATPANAAVTSGRRTAYLIRVTNPNPVPVGLRSVSVCLPQGFAYGGSTSGAIRVAPRRTACGDGRVRLTWTKAITVPAGRSVTFRAGVVTAGQGRVRITLTGRAQPGFAVSTAGPTAPITVRR